MRTSWYPASPWPEEANIVRPSSPPRPRARRTGGRRWRRQGRKAQVSAVAVILSLLLVVTVIATYLSTTLPNQMAVNDLNHETQVENQVGTFAALLPELAQPGNIGGQVTQPITLGSAGAPPFASSDSSTIIPRIAGYNGTYQKTLASNTSLSYTLLTPLNYNPPTGWVAGGKVPTGCPATTTTISCTSAPSTPVKYNFTGNSPTYTASLGILTTTMYLNYSTNGSAITITAGSTHVNVEVIGNSNTLTITPSASASAMILNVLVIGNSNTISSAASSGTNTGVINVLGNSNKITAGNSGPGALRLVLYGSSNTISFPTTTGTSNKFSVFINGFNAVAPTSTLCPAGNLSSTTVITKFTNSTGDKNVLTATFNNSIGYYNNKTNGTGWKNIYQNVPTSTCPYIAQTNYAVSSTTSAGLLVSMKNTYAPAAQVAYDQGAVIYAQPGGYPVMEDPPSLSYASSTLKLFEPIFTVNTTAAQSGTGTASLAFRLLSTHTVTSPSNGWSMNQSLAFKITYVSPFASAWMTYFCGVPAVAPYVTLGWGSAALSCKGSYAQLYEAGAPMGTVTLTFPAGTVTSITIQYAVFAVSLD